MLASCSLGSIHDGGRGCFAYKMSLKRGSVGIDDQIDQQRGDERGRDPGPFFEGRALRAGVTGAGLAFGARRLVPVATLLTVGATGAT